MYKLSGHSLTRESFFLPESQGLILQERESTCTITLGPDAPEIEFDDWILDDEWPEGNYVWRVKSLGDQTNTETRTIELEHVIKRLDDISVFGEVTTQDISGGSTATARQAIVYLLNRQSDWVLGDFAFDDVSNPYEFGGESLLDGISAVTDTLEDPVWEYDVSVYPFRLHIRRRSTAVSCEMRAGRNLSTLKRSINRSGMYTRIYPVGKNDLHISGEYISRNENLYGRIDHIETDQGKSTEDGLRAWALGRLKRHCEPTVSISVSGLELSGETGEDLDALTLNKVCQCPLPEYGTTITERIVKKQWRDRRKEPENVTISLCNSSADVATIIKEQTRSGGRGAAGQAKQNYLFEANENHLYYEVFDDCGHLHGLLEMTKESLRIDFDNRLESTRSELLMTSESLRIMFENDITSARSEFEMTAQSLRVEFSNTTSSLRTLINAEAGKIQQIVEAVGSNGTVTAASIILAINGDTSSAKISANEIDIDGLINGLRSKTLDVGTLLATGADIGGTIAATEVDATTVTADVVEVNGYNVYLSDASVSGNTLTITKTDGTTITFNKAASVTLSGAWSGTVSAGKSYKVTASPGGETIYSPSLDGMAANASSKTWASDYKSFNQEISVYDSRSEDLYKETLTFNTTPAWNAGSNAAGVVADVDSGTVHVEANTSTKSVVISAGASITYNSSTHKYTATGIAKAGASQMDSASATGGTEAFDAGVIAGQGAVYTGVSAREVLSTGGTTYYAASSKTVVGRGDSITGREVLDTGGTAYYTTANGKRLYHHGTYGLYELDEGVYRSVGVHDWYYVNSGSGTYYYTRANELHLGDAKTYYKGNGGTKTVQSSTQIHLGAEETLYRRS